MDTLQGSFSDHNSPDDGEQVYTPIEADTHREAPPLAIGQDERRMQVRAYNFWASLLEDRSFPSIEDLDPENLPDFGPNSVLLDFTSGIEDPAVAYLGAKLADECGTEGSIGQLSDVPSRSLLSRITDHYLQIIANQAPIGFEAEFVNQRGATIMYRGILLPFSSDDDTIDFIYGVINWKELADQQMTDQLLNEVNEALASGPELVRHEDALPEWADGPLDGAWNDRPVDLPHDDVLDLATQFAEPGFTPSEHALSDWDEESSDQYSESEGALELNEVVQSDFDLNHDGIAEIALPGAGEANATPKSAPEYASLLGPLSFAEAKEPLELSDVEPLDFSKVEPLDLADTLELTHVSADAEIVLNDATSPDDMELVDWLASAREYAYAAHGTEDRSRQALYDAIGRAYDFSIAASSDQEGLAELLADAGLKTQERSPMTPIAKLVFGVDYDKTRLAEFSLALAHAHRMDLASGALAGYLASSIGGLKGVVTLERKLRSEEKAKPELNAQTPRDRLARKLRKLDHQPLDQVSSEGAEFTVLVARRLSDGQVVMLGEVSDDAALLERAARKLLV